MMPLHARRQLADSASERRSSPCTRSRRREEDQANQPRVFAPRTREVQRDEKWSFVFKKQKNCDPLDPADDQRGDWWDHVAYDPEHRLVLAVVPGARVTENAVEVVQQVADRTEATPELF